MAEDNSLQDLFDDKVLEMIEKQSEYLQKLRIEPTVANPDTNGQTEETKHVEEVSSSVCLDDEELEMLVDQQKNCNTRKKTISDLRKWYGLCESVDECRKIGQIPPTELDRLLGHFFCKDDSLYEPDTLTSFQRSLDRHLIQELRKPYSIIRDTRFSSSREKLKAVLKMLKKKGKEIRTMLLNHWKWMTLSRCGPVDLWGLQSRGTTQYCLTHAAYGDAWKR